MEKGKERKTQLLSIALDEFISKGFYGTTTREICRIAKINSSFLFYYFSNKESIYLELIRIGVEKMHVNTAEAMKGPKEYLFQVLLSIFEQLENNPFFRKMFVFINDAQHANVGITEVQILLKKAAIVNQWVPIIQKGQEMNCFHKGNPQAMCVALFGAVQGIAQEKTRVPQTPLPDVRWLMKLVEVENE